MDLVEVVVVKFVAWMQWREVVVEGVVVLVEMVVVHVIFAFHWHFCAKLCLALFYLPHLRFVPNLFVALFCLPLRPCPKVALHVNHFLEDIFLLSLCQSSH